MIREEKILLMQKLLEDIRGNWGWENGKSNRINKALELSKELGMTAHVKRIEDYINSEYQDGRHFRTNYMSGGYEGMQKLHGLNDRLISGRSEEFKKLSEEYLTFPDSRFDDWIDEDLD